MQNKNILRIVVANQTLKLNEVAMGFSDNKLRNHKLLHNPHGHFLPARINVHNKFQILDGHHRHDVHPRHFHLFPNDISKSGRRRSKRHKTNCI